MNRVFRIALAALAAVGFVPVEAGGVEDPIYVYYSGRDCHGDVLELETFDREEGEWRAHPAHPRIPARSCQREEAALLLNELRWRCEPLAPYYFAPPWRGVDVFEPEVMSRCAVGQIDRLERRSAISVDLPREGVAVRAEDPRVQLEGSVRVDGVDGEEYDVIWLIDRWGEEAGVEAQIRTARAFAQRLHPRLGAVRFAVVSYGRGASWIALDWSGSATSIDSALRGLRPSASPPTAPLADALDTALELLARARPAARRVLVLGVNGSRFDTTGAVDPDGALLEAARRVAERSADLHWFVLGGLSAEPPPAVQSALEAVRGSYRRVAPNDFGGSFLADLVLPVAESLWVENRSLDARGAGAVDSSGRFAARVPVQPGVNRLVIHAKLSDGSGVERPFELVFNAALVLERILEAERSKIRAVRQRRLELEVED